MNDKATMYMFYVMLALLIAGTAIVAIGLLLL